MVDDRIGQRYSKWGTDPCWGSQPWVRVESANLLSWNLALGFSRNNSH